MKIRLSIVLASCLGTAVWCVASSYAATPAQPGVAEKSADKPGAAPPKAGPPGGTNSKLPVEYYPYLDAARTAAGVPAPPADGSPAAQYDAAVYAATRSLKDGPRWKLAAIDGGPGMLNYFSCAVGVPLTKETTPSLTKLMAKMRTDEVSMTRAMSSKAPARPYTRDNGQACVATEKLRPEWPSLQSAWGWSVGMLLSEALPELNDAIMKRARIYGDSEIVCGTATASSVSAGREVAGALIATLQSDAAFAKDLADAKQQIRALVNTGAQLPEVCAADPAAGIEPL